MRFIYCGDIVGRSGRDLVVGTLPYLKRKLNLDFIIVNGENAAHGFGITVKICEELFSAGADVILTGNHVWDQREIIPYIDKESRLLRPLNYPEGTPGKGVAVYQTTSGKKIVVAQVMGRMFVEPLDCPFAAINKVFLNHSLHKDISAIVIDIHGEATSEKMAFAHFCDGRASLVAGTHSHIPTADAQIMTGGTAYITDVGMCGDYDSVIGMKKEESVLRFVKRIKGEKFTPAEGDATFCAVYVETDDKTGLAVKISPVIKGGRLITVMP